MKYSVSKFKLEKILVVFSLSKMCLYTVKRYDVLYCLETKYQIDEWKFCYFDSNIYSFLGKKNSTVLNTNSF